MSPCIQHFGRLGTSVVQKVWLADNSMVPVVGQGDIVIHGPGEPVTIRDVLYIPSLSVPLLSVPAVFDHGGSVRFTPDSVELFSSQSHSVPVLTGHRAGTSWRITVRPLSSPVPHLTQPQLLYVCSVQTKSHAVKAVRPQSVGQILPNPRAPGACGIPGLAIWVGNNSSVSCHLTW